MRALPLLLTGERTLPGIWHENYWFRRHEAGYAAAAAWLPIAGTVVDAGAGEGYGAALLRIGRRHVIALDYDAAAVRHASQMYAVPTARANLVAWPLGDRRVLAVVSLQVIEHLWDQPRFVAECGRVLTGDGVLVLSTPNRPTFSPGVGRGRPPLNPFHVNEYDAEELSDLLSRCFARVDLYAVSHGGRIQEWEGAHGSVVQAQLATAPTEWSAPLADLVRSITTDDFKITDRINGDALDLLAIARSPR